MANDGQPWIFEQLGGERKTFTLSGWSAPHGRPRQGAVVRQAAKGRTERVYYPGSDKPTRHVFGNRYEDVELKGRFRDKDLGGKGSARNKSNEVESFRADNQRVRVTWGNIISFEGFISEYDPGYEAASEIEWVLRIEVDAPEQAAKFTVDRPKAPQDNTAALVAALNAVTAAIELAPLPGDIGDLIGNLVSTFTGAVGLLTGVAGRIRNFKDATFAQVNRVLSAVQATRSAGISLRDTFASLPADIAIIRERASDVIALQDSQATIEEQMREAMNACSQFERGADLARVGRIKATYAATNGDTWESISRRFYGNSDRGNELRDANNAGPGALPIPGFEYLIPA